MSKWHTIEKANAKMAAEHLFKASVALIDLITETSGPRADMYRAWARELSDHLDVLVKAESPNMY